MAERCRPPYKFTGRGQKTPPFFIPWGVIVKSKTNPRYANGNLRRRHRAYFRSIEAPCGICGGRLGPIHYDEPSDADHPLSFVIDEIHPVSRWKEFGYPSPSAAARDFSNLQAAHRCCNAMKGAKVDFQFPSQVRNRKIVADGNW